MNVERRESLIHGSGVFVCEPIEKEDWAYIYGEIVPLDRKDLEHFCVEADEGMFLPYRPFRWLNHSTEPNCEICGDDTTYWVKALRNIEAGEELVIDYGYTP